MTKAEALAKLIEATRMMDQVMSLVSEVADNMEDIDDGEARMCLMNLSQADASINQVMAVFEEEETE